MTVDIDRNRQEGTSLVELMLSMIVGLVLIGAVLSVVIQQSHLRQSNAESSLAVGAALNTLERLRTLDDATFPTLDGTGFDIPGLNGQPGGLQPVPGDLDGLPGHLSVLVEQTSGGATLYRVVATVSWTGAGGRKRINLQSFVGERK